MKNIIKAITLVPHLRTGTGVSIERTNFETDELCWALRMDNNTCYSKPHKEFCYEILPSGRDEQYIKENRYSSLLEALEDFKNYLDNLEKNPMKDYMIANFHYDVLKKHLSVLEEISQ